MNETLTERQLEREKRQIEEGIGRYFKEVDAQELGDQKAGMTVAARAVAPLVQQIKEMVASVERGEAGSGKPAVCVSYLSTLQPEPVAYITARACLSGAARRDTRQKIAMRISQLIHEHVVFDQLMQEEPNLGNSSLQKGKRWATSHHKRAIIRKAANVAGVRGLQWGDGDRLRLGFKLIEMFSSVGKEEGKELVVDYKDSVGTNNTPIKLILTERAIRYFEDAHVTHQAERPRYVPMVCEPCDWTTPQNGGYLTRDNQIDFIGGLSEKGAESFKDELYSTDLSRVFQAVNAIQKTRWSVNRSVYDVMSELWAAGSTLAGLPNKDAIHMPPRPSGIPKDLRVADMDEGQKATLADYRRAASKAHEEIGRCTSKILAVITQLGVASDLLEYEAFYFPHNLDFRGRVYPVATVLSPQSDDIGKSLLQFADGKPLGENGAYWLCVHVANLFGIDKVSFSERVEWVNENSAALLDSAMSPLDGQRFWTTADDPWQALAACFEFAGFQIAGADYVSHLPIAMDGSCSGLQHFSAMLKDQAGAEAVNLTGTEQPADVYTEVLNQTKVLLAEEDDVMATAWLPKLTRKIVKRPCMTFAYSVTSRGIRDQIIDEIRKVSDEYLPGHDNWQAGHYLAPIVEAAIRMTVKRAAEGMEWLKAAVRPVLDSGRPVTWTTPIGMPVRHRYKKMNGKRFNVLYKGERLKVQLRVESETHDIRKQVSAIAPNFVHSMDASHLMLVTNRMESEGITDAFAMIHDSFGVHACDVDELHYAIRDEFIQMYSVSQLEVFRNWMLQTLTKEDRELVPAVPEEGDFDLEEVRDADFFFA
jgi:DNA-directed RNA polymerase